MAALVRKKRQSILAVAVVRGLRPRLGEAHAKAGSSPAVRQDHRPIGILGAPKDGFRDPTRPRTLEGNGDARLRAHAFHTRVQKGIIGHGGTAEDRELNANANVGD